MLKGAPYQILVIKKAKHSKYLAICLTIITGETVIYLSETESFLNIGQKTAYWSIRMERVRFTFKESLVLLCILVAGAAYYMSRPSAQLEEQAAQIAQAPNLLYWQKNGDLHHADILTWQKASLANKRATCSHFFLALQNQNSTQYQGEDIQIICDNIVDTMDQRFSMSGTATHNFGLFKDKTVSQELVNTFSEKNVF